MKKTILVSIVVIAIIASFVTCTKETGSQALPRPQPQQISGCLDALSLECTGTIPSYPSV